MVLNNHDEISRFIFTLSVAKSGLPGRSYLVKEDFRSIIYDLIWSHPGLKFLTFSPLFHDRYIDVVVTRIFWDLNGFWTGKLTAHELRRFNFFESMHMLEVAEDVNSIMNYFSYRHFYVVYLTFWQLDTDHDFFILREDLKGYSRCGLTDAIIDRIFSSAVIRNPVLQSNGLVEKISFEDFAAFMFAEEDKKHPTSIEYWFRCLDLDGDGIISLYEMETFYKPLVEMCEARSYEVLKFKDVVAQVSFCIYVCSSCLTLLSFRFLIKWPLRMSI